ncbi:hypothetical protein ACHHYP_15814 [Achlya hypogyna]|uniref:Reverse transcriptase zinc-binding domain-containing protein n=1 Tax=Achlya hypogyna TaxID=1202772 RepID=A0A1V9ZEK3_ACHHY|nr:hypothetical protein ACHHYP_15814 [Achlya hypogyna]
MAVSPSSPAKALGIHVAPGLTAHARITAVLQKFRDRLQLWSIKTKTLAGKTVILKAVCLPVLWYHLTWVPPDTNTADCIDRMVIQFIHDEPPTLEPRRHGARHFGQHIIFTPKSQVWLMSSTSGADGTDVECFAFVQAAVAPSSASSWISPGEALFAAAYSPWGSFRDLLIANSKHPHILILLRSTLLPKTSKLLLLLLTDWFDVRSSPYVAPVLDATEQTLALPLWHNEFLLIYERDEDVWQGWHQRYAKPMAQIGCTHVHHLVRAMLCLPSFHHAIATRCYVAGVSLPSTSWLARLAHAVRRMLPFLTSAISPNHRPGILDTDPAKLVTSWLVKLDGRMCLPSAHINVANDFYEDRENIAAAVGLWLPTHALPKFSDCVYRVLIQGVAMRSELHYLEDKTCVLCNKGNRETYTHLLIDCPFTQDIWNLFTAALRAFGFSYPTSLQACLFDTPRLQRRWQCLCFDQVWPIVRACIWFTLYKARNDVIFRQDRTPATSEAVALKAAFVVKIHLQHLEFQDSEDHSLLRFLLALEQNVWARANLVPRCVI